MLDLRVARIALVLLFALSLLQFIVGVIAGLHQDWMKMSIYFFGTVLSIVICTIIPVGRRIDVCFSHMEDIISERIDSIKPVPKTTPNPKPIRMASLVIEKVVSIFMVISLPVHLSLGIFWGSREYWLGLGIHLSACAITVFICIGVLMSLRIDTLSKHLMELICGESEKDKL